MRVVDLQNSLNEKDQAFRDSQFQLEKQKAISESLNGLNKLKYEESDLYVPNVSVRDDFTKARLGTFRILRFQISVRFSFVLLAQPSFRTISILSRQQIRTNRSRRRSSRVWRSSSTLIRPAPVLNHLGQNYPKIIIDSSIS